MTRPRIYTRLAPSGPGRQLLGRLLLGALLLTMLTTTLSACRDASAELPVWTPDDHAQPPPAPEREPRTPVAARTEPSDPSRAMRALYLSLCAGCHGRDGSGDGPAAAMLDQPVQDLRDPAWQDQASNEDIARVIHQGSGQMPGFGQQLTELEIVALVEHIRSIDARHQAEPTP